MKNLINYYLESVHGEVPELPKELCVAEEAAAEQSLGDIMDSINQMGDSMDPRVELELDHHANTILNKIREDETI